MTAATTLTKTTSGILFLSNTLINRESLIDSDFATIDYRDSPTTNSSLLRYIKPETIITLDNILYNIGGVIPDAHYAYVNRTLSYEIPLLAIWLDVIDTSGQGTLNLSFDSVETLAVNQPWYAWSHLFIAQGCSVFVLVFL